MAMTQTQALDLINKVQQYYNLDFNDNKIDNWCEMLEDNGDYELSLKKLKARILSDNNYPPNLSEVLEKPYYNPNPQTFYQVDEETRRYQQSPEYREKVRKMQEESKRKVENGEITLDDL